MTQTQNSTPTSTRIRVTSLFTPTPLRTAHYQPESPQSPESLPLPTVTIQLSPSYDTLAKAVGRALSIILDSGDDYIFAPNQTMISDLVFLAETTDIDLTFLSLPEIKVSQLIESYDILHPIITHLAALEDADFQARRSWYYTHLAASIESALTYQHSAKGIIDALAAHNIKDQQTMAEQYAELKSDEVSTIIDFIKNTQTLPAEPLN